MSNLDQLEKNIIISQYLEEREFWERQLPEGISPTTLRDNASITQNGTGISLEVFLDSEIAEKIIAISSNSDDNLLVIFISSLNSFIAKYFNLESVLTGTTIKSEYYNDDLINTSLPLYQNVDLGSTFKEVLLNTKDKLHKYFEYLNFPVQHYYKTQNNIIDDQFKLFKIGIVLDNIQSVELFGEDMPEIIFNFHRSDNTIKLSVSNNSCYSKESLKIFVNYYTDYLFSIFQDLNQQIGRIKICSEQEIERISKFRENNIAQNDADQVNIGEKIDRIARETPKKICVIHENQTITYEELALRSNCIANAIQNKKVGNDALIMIIGTRSIEIITSMLGVVKAGCTYLLISTDTPKKRIKAIVDDCIPSWIINTNQDFDFDEPNIVLYKDINFSNESNQILKKKPAPSRNFYAIYTSGTTGTPKGLLVGQTGFISMINDIRSRFKVSAESKWSQLANPNFDGYAFEVWNALYNGACLEIVPQQVVYDPGLTQQWLLEKEITHTYQPTKIAEYLIDFKWEDKTMALQVMYTAGEKLRKHPSRELPFSFYNLYGPSEDTVTSTLAEINYKDHNRQVYPLIGKPISYKYIYILDSCLNVVPVGGIGELHIGGIGLCSGYINNPELTCDKFILNPFKRESILYKTGDLGSYNNDGEIYLTGRVDSLVKVHGFRIELEEIELAVKSFQGISDTVVYVKETDNNSQIVAFYISDDPISHDALTSHLGISLPYYMIPSFFVKVKNFPRLPSGKINYSELSKIDLNIKREKCDEEINYVEKILVQIWSEILGVDNVSVVDNYFMLGGDSIKAIQIISRLGQFNLHTDVANIFQYPSVSELAKHIEDSTYIAEQHNIVGESKLSPVQQWFFSRDFKDKHQFNIPLLLKLKCDITVDQLKRIVELLVTHHDALRTVFLTKESKIYQYTKEQVDISIDHFNIPDQDSESFIKKQCDILQKSFKLDEGPLFRVTLFETSDEQLIYFLFHHLVFDGVSLRIFLEDLYTCIQNTVTQKKLVLPLKTTSYKSWIENISGYAETIDESIINYWQEIDGKQMDINAMSLSGKISYKRSEQDTTYFILDNRNTDRLLKEVYKAYETEVNEILLSAVNIALIQTFQGMKSVKYELEGHGRQKTTDQQNLSRTLGWFTSFYPLFFDLNENADIKFHIENTKKIYRDVPNGGIDYSIINYGTDRILNNQQKDIQPAIGFNYLGQFTDANHADYFEFSNYDFGDAFSPESDQFHYLDIRGLVKNEALHMMIDYSPRIFSPEKINELSANIKSALINIINHCCEIFSLEKLEIDNEENFDGIIEEINQ